MARRGTTKHIRRRATNVATFNKVFSPCSTSRLQEWNVLLQCRQYLSSPWGYREVPYLFAIPRTSSSYFILWPVVVRCSIFVVERQTWRHLTKYFLLVQRRGCMSEMYCFNVANISAPRRATETCHTFLEFPGLPLVTLFYGPSSSDEAYSS